MPRRHLLKAITAVAVLLLVGQASFRTSSSTHTYTVQPGDSLWALSVRYKVGLNELASANGMQLTDLLLIGRQLVIPDRPSSPTPPADPGDGSTSTTTPTAAAPPPPPRHFSAAERAQMRSFCDTYRPPTGPIGDLPSDLLAFRDRLALRPLFVHWGWVYRIKPDLLEAIAWQESGWQNDAVSSAGAQGIGQIMPSTAAFLNGLMGTNLRTDVASDNIRMEARYIALLLAGTGDRACEAVASYYQGFTTLQNIGVLPESQLYVQSVLGLRPRFK